jgi:hypothetical protein
MVDFKFDFNSELLAIGSVYRDDGDLRAIGFFGIESKRGIWRGLYSYHDSLLKEITIYHESAINIIDTFRSEHICHYPLVSSSRSIIGFGIFKDRFFLRPWRPIHCGDTMYSDTVKVCEVLSHPNSQESNGVMGLVNDRTLNDYYLSFSKVVDDSDKAIIIKLVLNSRGEIGENQVPLFFGDLDDSSDDDVPDLVESFEEPVNPLPEGEEGW